MPRFSACLFDYGNTIVEFDRRQLDRIRALLAADFSALVGPIDAPTLGAVYDRVFMRPHEGESPLFKEFTPEEQMCLVLKEAFGDGTRITAALIDELNEKLQKHFVDSIMAPSGVAALLRRLRRHVKVGLVSNYPCAKAIRRSLEKVGLADLLDPVVVSGEVGYVKPHSGPFQAALEILRVPPGSVLFVGDRWDMDMIGARNAGMKTCHHVGYTSDLDLEERYRTYRPDFRIKDIEELAAILEE